jgi:hypothetical protein
MVVADTTGQDVNHTAQRGTRQRIYKEVLVESLACKRRPLGKYELDRIKFLFISLLTIVSRAVSLTMGQFGGVM